MNKHKTILIIDDEPLAIDYLKDTIEESLIELSSKIDYFKKNKIEIITSNNPKDTVNLVLLNKPILMFLDIQMPELNGIDVAKNIQNIKLKNNLIFPSTIFTTAYDEFGYLAFKVDAIDYILKPATVETVSNAIEKFYNVSKEKLFHTEEFLIVEEAGISTKINISDIIYFKAETKYVTIKTEIKDYIITDALIYLENKCPNFIKIHRSYLINPHYVQRFFRKEKSNFVLLKTQEVLPVSRRQKKEIKGTINIKELL